MNEALEETPETVNASPYEGGWIMKVRLADAGSLETLLDADAYQAVVDSDA